MRVNACNQCGGETELAVIGFADGNADPLRIRLNDLPLRRCEHGHRQFVRPQFPAELLQHLTRQDEPELPSGEIRGFIKKRYMCQICGEELPLEPDHRHIFSIEIELDGLAPFQVDLTMPVYRCRTCGREQMHSLEELRKLTPKALARAFDEADIPPPPGPR
jgi:DNA-directed RNA polymerase subunit RPC12/RpoP